jgi:hypothetical protein
MAAAAAAPANCRWLPPAVWQQCGRPRVRLLHTCSQRRDAQGEHGANLQSGLTDGAPAAAVCVQQGVLGAAVHAAVNMAAVLIAGSQLWLTGR